MENEVITPLPSGNLESTDNFLETMKVFKIPEDLKNDIIYCQRNLRNFIKVQKIITSKLMGNSKVPCLKLLEEIEMEIYEINAEQKYLLLRLKRILEEFYKKIGAEEVVNMNRYSVSQLIGATINSGIEDTSIVCAPITVQKRNNIAELMVKYNLLEVKVDSSGSKLQINSNLIGQTAKLNPTRISLLKPISERVNLNSNKSTPSAETNSNSVESESVKSTINLDANDKKKSNQIHNHLPTLRLNLLEALNKAKNLNSVANAQQLKPRDDLKNKTENIVQVSKEPKSVIKSDSNSGSEEQSNKISREQLIFNILPTNPYQLTQEMFLQIFELCTPEYFAHLQQRRSKRIRRPVYNNEKPDFHYGHIEFDNSLQSENRNKRKTLLLSPPAKSILNKRKKIASEINENSLAVPIIVDRSASSSPNENSCNECLKIDNDNMRKCKQCNGFYHESCHAESKYSQVPINVKEKICPSCLRINKKSVASDNQFVRRRALINQREYLQIQFDAQRLRRRSLLKQSEYYKRKMNQLFSIVQVFKTKKQS